MLDSRGFDLWADGYDRAVGLSDEDGSYPFAGYRAVLGRIYDAVLRREAPDVLDIGFGTGALAAKLYERGCRVWGQDFSPRMLEIARERMPGAKLFLGDFAEGLRPELRAERYDFIISTYALHHLEDAQKPGFIRGLLPLLKSGGALLIGDVAFETRAGLEACRAAAGDEWDDGECYFVAETLREAFPGLRFERVSHCAGILELTAES